MENSDEKPIDHKESKVDESKPFVPQPTGGSKSDDQHKQIIAFLATINSKLDNITEDKLPQVEHKLRNLETSTKMIEESIEEIREKEKTYAKGSIILKIIVITSNKYY